YGKPEFPTAPPVAESFLKDPQTGHEHTKREYEAIAKPGKARLLAEPFSPPAEPRDVEYPLVAITGRLAYHWHTRTKTQRAPDLVDGAPRAFVEIASADAVTLGISD